ncbi:MAG: hypothetical protein IJ475_00340 [Bacilli bacterium]|nr:hypothetical protein [Bacilli bacterium]
MKRKNRERRQFTYMTIFLALDLLLIFTLFRTSNARFTAEATSSTKLNVALYALSEENSFDIPLGNIKPSNDPYLYEFSVSNTDENGNVTETKLEYDLKIIATTNVPLEYKLYKNQSCLSSAGTNILSVHEPAKDDDGTYFLTMTTATETFSFEKEQTNTYCLLVTFPMKYNTSEYSDLIESVRLSIESEQIIEEA